MRTQHAQHGFTIPELIAIVAVTCCLILVTLPALANSEGRGLTVACRNNNRQLMNAFHMYADENNSYFAGNEGGSAVGSVWMASPLESSTGTNITHPRYNLFAPYLPPKHNVLRCPADLSAVRVGSALVPRNRSVSMNHAVGTKGSSGAQRAPVDGTWLDNFGHTANSRFYCYAKLSDIVAPRPVSLWIFIEEHPASINDGAFANVGPIQPFQYQMIDYPGAWHNGSAMVSFADGHAEEIRWTDPRTFPRQPLSIQAAPNSRDIMWLAERTTAPVPR